MKKQIIFTFLVFLISITTFPQAKNVIWSEDFEGNWSSDWYTDFGVWQVGMPTIGPMGAHGGNNCATVGLNSNYPKGFESRLIRINTFTIPDSTQNPRLRFWHWWSIGGECNGKVQLKVNGSSTWINISPDYTGHGGNIWNYAFVDLSAYANKTVQIALYFYSSWGTWAGQGPGWYVDDISLETGPIIFSLPETFEAGMGNWYNDFGNWQVGNPTIGPNGAHNGNNCATVGLNGNYLKGFESRLISPSFTIPDSTQNPRLRFWHW
ncbi:MAG: hypothetical protein WCP32_07465, partial [Bacteroidota bacterium]